MKAQVLIILLSVVCLGQTRTPTTVTPNDLGYRLGTIEAKIDQLSKDLSASREDTKQLQTEFRTSHASLNSRLDKLETRIDTALWFFGGAFGVGGAVLGMFLSPVVAAWVTRKSKVSEPQVSEELMPFNPTEQLAANLAERGRLYAERMEAQKRQWKPWLYKPLDELTDEELERLRQEVGAEHTRQTADVERELRRRQRERERQQQEPPTRP
jgi:outer membrane murein-binding lipoprotein Lpp